MQVQSTQHSQLRQRVLILLLLAAMAIGLAGCGSGSHVAANPGSLSGNWEIMLMPHGSKVPFVFSGFMIQSGKSVTGSVILGVGCQGVGPVTGTFDGTNLSLTINEFAQDISLTGTSSSTGSLSGSYSTLAGGCTSFASTGNFSAVQVPALSGSFHGTFSGQTNGQQTVSGTLMQGPNVGGSTATLSGSLNATSAGACPYLTSATLTGVISGTSVSLNIYGPSGTLIGQIPSTVAPATLAPDASSMNGGYVFSSQSSNCSGDLGTFQITFP